MIPLPPEPLQSCNGAITSYFEKELRLLRMFGVSLYENESIPYRIYSIFMIFFFSILFIVLYGYELTKHDFRDGISELITLESAIIIILGKILVVLVNREKITKLFAKLQRKPFLPNLERGGVLENQLTEECLWITRAQKLTLWTFPYIIFFGIISNTVRQRVTSSDHNDWSFPFGDLTVLNVTYGPNYEIIAFYQHFSMFFAVPVYTTVDLLLIGVLVHITYQFKILQNYIRQLVDVAGRHMVKNRRTENALHFQNSSSHTTDLSVISWKSVHKFFRKAVRYHQAILDLNEEVETIFNLLLLAQLLSTTIQLCLTIYVTSLQTDKVQSAKNAGVYAVVSFQAFLVSYWSQRVLHESQQVGQAANESNFVGTDIRFQKSLILIMRRSQKPWKITAGKFAVISLATFVWILQTSYSAFTVIQAVNTK